MYDVMRDIDPDEIMHRVFYTCNLCSSDDIVVCRRQAGLGSIELVSLEILFDILQSLALFVSNDRLSIHRESI